MNINRIQHYFNLIEERYKSSKERIKKIVDRAITPIRGKVIYEYVYDGMYDIFVRM